MTVRTAQGHTRGAGQNSTAAARPRTPNTARKPSGTALRAWLSAGWDYPLLAMVAGLLVLGLIMVYSASVSKDGAYYFLNQLKWVAVGVIVMLGVALVPYHWWPKAAVLIMAVALAALALVLVFGEERFGARRTFGGSIQPGEFAKFAVIIYVATWVSSKGKRLAEVEAGLAPFAVLMGMVAGLLVLEPSFSVAIIILLIGTTIFFLGGGDLRQLAISAVIGGVVLLFLLWQSGYGFQRITHWWQGLSDLSQMSYNVRQAIQLQRVSGLSLAELLQQKGMVPLLWSDFLFANIVADLKLLGGAGVVLMYALLGYRILTIALNAKDRFGALAASGVAVWILTQAMVHIGSSLALIPATGQPLPFMSYGGSALVSLMAGMGLLLSISRATPAKKAPYADFTFGGRHWGARLSDSQRDRNVARGPSSSRTPAKPAEKRPSR